MCDELLYAAQNETTPSPHIFLARMASHQTDCITMIEPNTITIRHAPQDEAQFGLAGLIKEIESRLPSKADPVTTLPGNDEENPDVADPLDGKEKIRTTGQRTPTENNIPRPISGTLDSLLKLHEAALVLKQRLRSQKSASGIKNQQKGILQRKVRRSTSTNLQATLKSDKKFWAKFEQDKWNDSHNFAFCNLLYPISLEENKVEREAKLHQFFDLIKQKKLAFELLDLDYRYELLRQLPPFSLAFLLETGFFSNPDFAVEILVNHIPLEDMKSFVDRDLALLPRLLGNDSNFTLVAKMLSAANNSFFVPGENVARLCDLLIPHAMAIAESATLEDFSKFLTHIPRLQPSLNAPSNTDNSRESVYGLLQEMFKAASREPVAELQDEKLGLIFERLQPRLKFLFTSATKAEVEWLIFIVTNDPAFDGNSWSPCHELLITMLDGAYDVIDQNERKEKSDLCRDNLADKISLFLATPDRKERISKMRSELSDGAIRALDKLGYFEEPVIQNTRKRSASQIASD